MLNLKDANISHLYRNGDLILSPSASHHAVNYRESVHNRLRAYDNIPSNSSHSQPSSMLQFSKMSMKTSGGGITNQTQINGLPPVTISQIGRFNEVRLNSNFNCFLCTALSFSALINHHFYSGL